MNSMLEQGFILTLFLFNKEEERKKDKRPLSKDFKK